MSIRQATCRKPFWLPQFILAASLLSACVQPPPPEPYSEPAREASPTRQSAVDLLQQEANLALENEDYPLAIETLQRAIRIEPRNPYNWHYLGQTYWQMGDLVRCRAMAERSVGFSSISDQLAAANDRLLSRCTGN